MLMANATFSVFQAVKALSKGPVSVMVCLEAAVFRRVGRSWLISEKSVPIWKSNTIKQRSWRWTKLGWGLVTARQSRRNHGHVQHRFRHRAHLYGRFSRLLREKPQPGTTWNRRQGMPTKRKESFSVGERSCKRLCHECGLKVEERRIETVSSCNCKFHWCCTVKCETCTQIVTKYVCAKRHKNRRPHNNSRRRQHARNRWTHLCKYINLYISNVNIWDFKICSFFSYCILFCIPASILDTGAFSFQLSIELITC